MINKRTANTINFDENQRKMNHPIYIYIYFKYNKNSNPIYTYLKIKYVFVLKYDYY